MVEFWVRQSKIRQILIRLLGRLLWSFVPFKMDIFWILAKFWISKVIYGNIYVIKKWEKWCYKSVNSSRKHPVYVSTTNKTDQSLFKYHKIMLNDLYFTSSYVTKKFKKFHLHIQTLKKLSLNSEKKMEEFKN